MNSFSTYFKDKNDKNDFYIAIVVIVLFLGCGLFYSLNLFNSQELLADTFKSDANVDTYVADKSLGFEFESEDDKTFTTTLLKDKRNVNQVDNWIATNQDTLIQIENQTSEPLSIQSMIDSIEARQKEKAIETKIDTTDKIIEITKKDTLETIENTTITSPKTEENSSKKEIKQPEPANKIKKDNTVASSNCVIVVGAFSVGKNADKLKDVLIKEGYLAYTFFRKGNKVVGIKQSCDNSKATQKILKQIQAKYNSSAWILKK